MLGILADYGHDSEPQREAAFQAGLAALGDWARGQTFASDRSYTVAALDRSLDVLLGLNTRGRESLLLALSSTAAHDGRLAVAEAELIRAVCATLNFPLPPILVHR